MNILRRLFGGSKSTASTPDKAAALERVAAMFNAMKAEYLKVVIEGLADPDVKERKATAFLIADRIAPALEDDTNPESRRLSMGTLARLATELRPPSNDTELSDLDNAVFYFAKRKLHEWKR